MRKSMRRKMIYTGLASGADRTPLVYESPSMGGWVGIALTWNFACDIPDDGVVDVVSLNDLMADRGVSYNDLFRVADSQNLFVTTHEAARIMFCLLAGTEFCEDRNMDTEFFGDASVLFKYILPRPHLLMRS